MPEIYVKVKPGASEFRLEGKTYPVIHLENEASEGRANHELKTRLKDLTGEKIRILSGHQSRRKKIGFDMDKKEFLEKMGLEDG